MVNFVMLIFFLLSTLFKLLYAIYIGKVDHFTTKNMIQMETVLQWLLKPVVTIDSPLVAPSHVFCMFRALP